MSPRVQRGASSLNFLTSYARVILQNFQQLLDRRGHAEGLARDGELAVPDGDDGLELGHRPCGYEPIYIIDSLTVSAGIQILVNYACKLRDSGLPAAGIAEEVERLKDQVRVFAVVDTLEYLRRGGPWAPMVGPTEQ